MIFCDHLRQYKLEGCRLLQAASIHNLQCSLMERDNFPCQMQTNSDSTSLFHLVETVKNQLSFLFFNPFSPIGDIQLIIVRIFFQQNLNQASCICIFYGIFSVHFPLPLSARIRRRKAGILLEHPFQIQLLFLPLKAVFCLYILRSVRSDFLFSASPRFSRNQFCASLRSTYRHIGHPLHLFHTVFQLLIPFFILLLSQEAPPDSRSVPAIGVLADGKYFPCKFPFSAGHDAEILFLPPACFQFPVFFYQLIIQCFFPSFLPCAVLSA